MNETDPIVIIISSAVILTIPIAIFYLANTYVARRWRKHQAETVAKWEADGVEFTHGPVGGQFGGLESMGEKGVITGIGFMALTTKDLRVTRANPSAEWHLSFRQIKGVAIQPAFLGKKSKKTPFIVVRFKQEGKADKLSFQVNDFENWAKVLAKKAGVSLKDLR